MYLFDMGSGKLSAKELTTYSLAGAIMFSLKLALSSIPNVEPVSMLVIVYALVFGKKGLIPTYIYIILEFIFYGISIWSITYLYVWLILFLIAYKFRNKKNILFWAIVSAIFGLSFGGLCGLINIFMYDFKTSFAWWLSGIKYDLLHGIGNFFVTLIALKPIKNILEKINKKMV